jgi:hypothetical protein
MMAFCERLSEQLALVATIDPAAGASGALTTDAFSMSLHRRALFILSNGAGTAGVGVAIQECPNTAFGGGTATILTGSNLVVGKTTLTQYLYEVSAEAMATGMTALRGVFTSVGADIISVVVLADVERYHADATDTLGTSVIHGVAN